MRPVRLASGLALLTLLAPIVAHSSSATIARLMSEERYREAIPLAERQLAQRTRALGPRHPMVANALDTLGRLEYTQGAFEQAYDHHTRALAIRQERLGDRSLEVAASLEELGHVQKVMFNGEDPMLCYRRALDIRLAALGPNHPDVARIRIRIANLHRMRTEYDAALIGFSRAIEVQRKSLGPRHADLGSSLSDLALTLIAKGDWERAEAPAREALAIQRALPLKREQDYPLCLDVNARLLAHRGRYAAAESLLTESAALREAHRKRAAPGTGRTRMFPLLMYLDLAQVQLAQGKGEPAWASLEKSLARGLCELKAEEDSKPGDGVRPLPLEEVQRSLEPDVALIGWFETRRGGGTVISGSWGYVIRDRGPIHWQRISGPEGATSLVSGRYLKELRAAGSWPLRVTDLDAVLDEARRHHARNLAPLASHLNGVRRLIVISPDILSGVPVESWADPQGRFVAERYLVSYAPSAAWFVRLHRQERPRPPDQWRALLVGIPTIPPQTTLADAASSTVSARSAVAQSPDWLMSASYPALPRARAEVNRVGALMGHADVLVGEQASEAALHRLATSGELAKFDLLHFATHAVIDGSHPGKSALLLAGGSLSADEIRHDWKLDAELVSLSACRTGLGVVTRTEGPLGLHHAILGAGARSLLVSLWDVDDTAQSLLVARFYENLAGRARATKTEALSEARSWLRAYRDPQGRTPFAHPAYWASFVLIGDPL